MQLSTLDALIKTHSVEVDPHLDRQLTVPVDGGLQRQGDVIVIPFDVACNRPGVATPRYGVASEVPREGIPVVRGEAGGNTHLLLADGPVFWALTESQWNGSALDLGVLIIEDGSVGYLAHPEHGYAGIAPGKYVISRQREQADEIRMVAD